MWNKFAAALDFVNGQIDDPKTYADLKEKLDADRSRERDAGQPHLLPGDPARALPSHSQNLREGRAHLSGPSRRRQALVARGHREALRARSRVGPRAEPAGGRVARREPDVPHRPLPRQRDGAEHPRLPLRATPSSSRFGTASTSTTSRSPRPRRSASRSGASFYDETGVVRDIVQNHLLQVLALCAMEPPVSFGADDVRNEKVQVLRSLRPITGERRPHERGARAVRGLPPRGRGTRRLANADLRGDEGPHRQLALAGRALLPARRQEARRSKSPRCRSTFSRCPRICFRTSQGDARCASPTC